MLYLQNFRSAGKSNEKRKREKIIVTIHVVEV